MSSCVGHFVFTEEAWFHLSGYVNRPNIRTQSTQNSLTLQEHPVHPSQSAINVEGLGNELGGYFFFKKLGGGGVDFSVSCNYTLFVTFLVILKKK